MALPSPTELTTLHSQLWSTPFSSATLLILIPRQRRHFIPKAVSFEDVSYFESPPLRPSANPLPVDAVVTSRGLV